MEKILLLPDALKEAFSHCRSVEKTAAFNDSVEWLECAVDVFDSYKEEEGLLTSLYNIIISGVANDFKNSMLSLPGARTFASRILSLHQKSHFLENLLS